MNGDSVILHEYRRTPSLSSGVGTRSCGVFRGTVVAGFAMPCFAMPLPFAAR
jgi:hypothetical protein